MNRLIYISLALLLLTSCSAERQAMRRANRAAKLIEKAKRIDPTIAQMQVIEHNISMRSPQVDARIVQQLAIPLQNESPDSPFILHPSSFTKDTLPATVFPIYLQDDSLTARISLQDGNIVLDYTIAPQPCDTLIKTEYEKIDAPRYIPKPLTWLQRTRITIGDISLIILLIYIGYRLTLGRLNKL